MAAAALEQRRRRRPDGIRGTLTTPSYRALDFSFTLECDDPELSDRLAVLLGAMRAPEPSTATSASYRIAGEQDGLVLTLDGDVVARSLVPGDALDWLLWDLTRATATAGTERLLLHAGAVSRDGAGVIIPGVSGAGKSTLTAALVLSGFDYLTDEMAALSPDGSVSSFPRPLSLDDGARTVLAATFGGVARLGATPVAPDELRPGATAASARLRAVVMPRRGPASPAEPQVLSTSDALLELITHSVNLDVHGGAGVAALAALADAVPCVRLSTDDLGRACRAVAELVATGP